jgi:hypothetical protein
MPRTAFDKRPSSGLSYSFVKVRLINSRDKDIVYIEKGLDIDLFSICGYQRWTKLRIKQVSERMSDLLCSFNCRFRRRLSGALPFRVMHRRVDVQVNLWMFRSAFSCDGVDAVMSEPDAS